MSLHSLMPHNVPNMYVRHRDFKFIVTPVESYLDKRDATLWFEGGWSDKAGVSFEALNFPHHFVRHFEQRLILSPQNDSDTLLPADSTFFQRPGLADGNAVSFESCNFPGRYIRHRDFQLWVEEQVFADDPQFAADATFWIVDGLATFPVITAFQTKKNQTGGEIQITAEGLTNGGDVAVSFTGIPNGAGSGLTYYPNPYIDTTTISADDNGHFTYDHTFNCSTTDPADRNARVLVWVRDVATGNFAIQTVSASLIWTCG